MFMRQSLRQEIPNKIPMQISEQISEQIQRLPLAQQRHVLDYIRLLQAAPAENTAQDYSYYSSPALARGITGKELLALTITIEAAELTAMQQAITQECRKIDSEGWDIAERGSYGMVFATGE